MSPMSRRAAQGLCVALTVGLGACTDADGPIDPEMSAPTVTTASLPNGAVGQAYSQTFAATGGDGSYTWSVSSGSLPAGLSLDPSSGAITGTPTAAGTSTFTVQVTSAGLSGTKSLSITIDAPYPAFTWPMPGVEGVDWVINNYVDLDAGPGILDYRGGAKAYDGHNGVDVDVPNFRWMDNGFAVLAAAPGMVTALHDGEYDRNTSCTGTWNFVEVTHANGSRAIYGHLKNGSLAVAMGQAVTTGEQLGVVGSSGCSTQPHLHFELRSAAGSVVDPFQSGLWATTPVYDPPLTLMDVYVKDGAITGIDELKDPPPNATALALGNTLAVGMSMAGGGVGDRYRVTFESPNGTLQLDQTTTFSQQHRHTYWWWQRAADNDPGVWTLTIYINDTVASTFDVNVVP